MMDWAEVVKAVKVMKRRVSMCFMAMFLTFKLIPSHSRGGGSNNANNRTCARCC